MKKAFKIVAALMCLATLLGVICLVAACDNTSPAIEDETQWKQAFENARKSDQIHFKFELYDTETAALSMSIEMKASGNVEYLKQQLYDVETGEADETWEYYYDGEYIYLNVSEADLGYTWQKISVEDAKEEFPEPLSIIELIYDGDMFPVSFDGLDELSERYADASSAVVDGIREYSITDGDAASEMSYKLRFAWEKGSYTGLELTSTSQFAYIFYGMGKTQTIAIPTASVQEAE